MERIEETRAELIKYAGAQNKLLAEISRLTAELAAEKRRADAAVSELQWIQYCGTCKGIQNGDCEHQDAKVACHDCKHYDWRGPCSENAEGGNGDD